MNLGKILYRILFLFCRKLALNLSGVKGELWYRNSLFLDYFAFGKSDIDVSLYLIEDHHLQANAKKISSLLHLCPLIKEMNVYSPYSFKHSSSLMNYFEWQRDPGLSKFVQVKPQGAAEASVYLARMAFANLKTKALSARDVKKWSYHFHLTGKKQLVSLVKTGMSTDDLLKLIANDIDSTLAPVFVFLAEEFRRKTPLYDQWLKCPDQQNAYLLLPQHFCFAEIEIKYASRFLKEFFLAQLAWEVWAMMTQPMSFSLIHLENIKKALQNDLGDNGLVIRQKQILFIVEDFISSSSARP